MASQPESIRRTSFGPFEFDEHSCELLKFGNRLRLSGKPLQILSLLVSRPGEIVGRDELQRHLWGDTSFGDFEQGLNTAVNKLRQTLGDSAEQGRYVETVPGRGYVFVRPSNEVPTESSSKWPISPRYQSRLLETAHETGMGGWPGSFAVYLLSHRFLVRKEIHWFLGSGGRLPDGPHPTAGLRARGRGQP